MNPRFVEPALTALLVIVCVLIVAAAIRGVMLIAGA